MRQRGDDLGGARLCGDGCLRRARVLRGRIGPADENLVAARCAAQARDVHGTEHFELVQRQHAVLAAARHLRVELAVRFRERSMQERDAEPMHAGRRVERDVLQACVDRVDGRRADLVQLFEILAAADVELEEFAAVEHGDDSRLVLLIEAPEARHEITDVEPVFAVGREVVLDDRAAARAERQARHVKLLRSRVADRVRHADGAGARVADGLRGQCTCGAQELVDERRRHRQRVGDVVEAVLGAVDGQQRRGVDLERQEIANRVRVLRAVHAVRCHVARRSSGRGGVERRLEPRDERVVVLAARF